MAARSFLLQTHSDSEAIEGVLEIIEPVTVAVEVLAVVVIVVSIVRATWRFVTPFLRKSDTGHGYQVYRAELGYGLLLGLELLVAADVIRTVALEPSFENVSVLGMLVAIRIVLGWSIVVEIEQRWPWQRAKGE
jgi:uncharacterized membrane protein